MLWTRRLLILSLSLTLFLTACNLNPFKTGSDDSGSQTTGTTIGGFTVAEVNRFVADLYSKNQTLLQAVTVPAFSHYRFDLMNPAGGLRMATIVPYEQAASYSTFGIEDTAKVLLWEAAKRKAGYSIEYFSFIASFPADRLTTLTGKLLEQYADVPFITKSASSLASGTRSDLWYTSDGVTWTSKTTAITPARSDYGFVSNGQRLFVLGGLGTGVQYNDVWGF